jgi:hypothetical protein
MLHCNMDASRHRLRLALEDLLGDLAHARRTGDLGRVALLVYCELRRWARMADQQPLAEHAHELFLGAPYADRDSFLREVDALLAEAGRSLNDDTGDAALPEAAPTDQQLAARLAEHLP